MARSTHAPVPPVTQPVPAAAPAPGAESAQGPSLAEWEQQGAAEEVPGAPRQRTRVPPVLAVLLDPAHGGPDTGAWWEDPRQPGKVYREKDLMLGFVETLITHLADDVQPYMSRRGDQSLAAQPRFFGPQPYDVAVTFHVHAGKDIPAGPHACIVKPNDPVTSKLAADLVAAIAKGLGVEPAPEKQRVTTTTQPALVHIDLQRRDRWGYGASRLRAHPTRRAAMMVAAAAAGLPRPTREFGTPAVMLVLGNLDNPETRRALLTTAAMNNAAKAAAEAINALAPLAAAITKHYGAPIVMRP